VGCLGFFEEVEAGREIMRLYLKSGPTWGGQSKMLVVPQQSSWLSLLQLQLLLLSFSEAGFSKRDRNPIPPVKNLAVFLSHQC